MSDLLSGLTSSFSSGTGLSASSAIGTAASTPGGFFGVKATQSMIQALPDIAPNWMWTCDIINVPTLFGVTNIYARQFSFTHDSFDTEQRYRNGTYQTFPRHQLVHPVQIMFYEPFLFSITQFIYNWQGLIRNKQSGYFGLPAGYMGTIYATLFDTVGIPQCVMEIDGVWPIGIMGENLSYDHSDAVATNVEFSTNGCRILYTGAGFVSLFANAITSLAGAGLNSLFGTADSNTNFSQPSDNVIGGGDGSGDLGDADSGNIAT